MKQHGHNGSPTYKSWDCMRQRCNRPLKGQEHYVELGYDPAWNDFRVFLADMGVRPDNKTLDRIDNSKGYSKENCRWATAKEQARNRKDNTPLTWKGKTLLICEWAEELNMNIKTLHTRLHRGWSVDDALGRVVQLK